MTQKRLAELDARAQEVIGKPILDCTAPELHRVLASFDAEEAAAQAQSDQIGAQLRDI